MAADSPAISIVPSRESTVGSTVVRRALPQRDRRTVGPWCFADHMGPDDHPSGIGPHPHIGLQTVTWILDGALVHRDSLGTEQEIRPGQLNLMTAGRGVSHAEELSDGRGGLHGIQLWVAQPDATRGGPPAFEHHAELPEADLAIGTATVLVGSFAGATAATRRDTDHAGAELRLQRGRTTVPLDPTYEHAFVVLEGVGQINGSPLRPGRLAHLPTGVDEIDIAVDETARIMILGGTPFEAPVKMWWNYVARSLDEIDEANRDWIGGHDRYGDTGSRFDRIEPPAVSWTSGSPSGDGRGVSPRSPTPPTLPD
ncbi:MAG: pirin family protein [Acidimicrobiales bacterium]|nr:pirin family protein [Acidimicrobiales bacterium]